MIQYNEYTEDDMMESFDVNKLSSFTKAWIKPGTNETRLYLQKEPTIKFLNLKLEYYKTGNIKHAYIDDECISNTQARKILSGFSENPYFDVKKNKWMPHSDTELIRAIENKLK